MGFVVRALGTLLLATPVAAQATRASSPTERDRALESAAAQAAAGHPAEAARLLRDAALRFHSVRALLQLSHLQTSQKDVGGALESLRQARAIAPNSEEVLSAYAETSLAAHATLPALSALDALTRLCPTVARYRYLEGAALTEVGDTAAAVEALKEAERLEPISSAPSASDPTAWTRWPPWPQRRKAWASSKRPKPMRAGPWPRRARPLLRALSWGWCA